MWPQIVFLSLMAIGFGISLALYGERRRGTYNFGYVFVVPVFTLWLLYEGGFFAAIGLAP
ncbi:hypothetical protein [Bradyrhizobium sp. th.b2]|uniref:hypothetical protein n=1 Tax=Bradyrhizobium sp. th-b2 TaxID=172088 RepID=UPI00041CF294|nr:hypothetical protein [Bradyrhizobium sp. th.b2]